MTTRADFPPAWKPFSTALSGRQLPRSRDRSWLQDGTVWEYGIAPLRNLTRKIYQKIDD
jgi:hypothetical protein